MNKLQNNVVITLQRMISLAQEDSEHAEAFAVFLEPELTHLHEEDVFGTEAQHDPRGDFRDGKWSLYGKVQPVYPSL